MKSLTITIVASVSLTGCMRIYADPELPDINLEWNSGDCETSEVSVGLVDLDDGTVGRYSAPCNAGKLTLEDVDRKLYRLDGAQVQPDATIFATSSTEVDLRNGFNEEAFLYFEDPRLVFTWSFDMDATCQSLEIDSIAVDFDFPDQGYSYSLQTSCDLGVYAGYPFGQTVSLKLRGISRRKTIAASPQTPTFELSLDQEATDLGTLTLTLCGDDCPSGPQPF